MKKYTMDFYYRVKGAMDWLKAHGYDFWNQYTTKEWVVAKITRDYMLDYAESRGKKGHKFRKAFAAALNDWEEIKDDEFALRYYLSGELYTR